MHSYFCLFCLLSPHVVTLWRSGAYWLGVDEVGVGKEEEDLSCLLGILDFSCLEQDLTSGQRAWFEVNLPHSWVISVGVRIRKGEISLDTSNAVSKLTIPRNGPGSINAEILKPKFFLNISTFVPDFLCMIFFKTSVNLFFIICLWC